MLIELRQQHTRDIVRPVYINPNYIISIVSSYEGKTFIRIAVSSTNATDDYIEVLETIDEVLGTLKEWNK